MIPFRLDVRLGLAVYGVLCASHAVAFGVHPDTVASPVYDWVTRHDAGRYAFAAFAATAAALAAWSLARADTRTARLAFLTAAVVHAVGGGSILKVVLDGAASAATAALVWWAHTVICLIWLSGGTLREVPTHDDD